MNEKELARKLRDIGSKVRCMPAPNRRNPDAFHENRSELAHELDRLALMLDPSPNGSPRSWHAPDVRTATRR